MLHTRIPCKFCRERPSKTTGDSHAVIHDDTTPPATDRTWAYRCPIHSRLQIVPDVGSLVWQRGGAIYGMKAFLQEW